MNADEARVCTETGGVLIEAFLGDDPDPVASTEICHGEKGDKGDNGAPGSVVTVSPDPADCGDEGGFEIFIDDVSQGVICNGKDAPNVDVAEELPGANCEHGGVAITVDEQTLYACNGAPGEASEVEANRSESLEACDGRGGVVITIDETDVAVCDGAEGKAGEDGSTPDIRFTSVSAEQAEECTETGGVRIEVFLGDDPDPVASTEICHGTDGSDGATPQITIEQLEIGDDDCAVGGVLIEIHLNGEVVDSAKVCHGEPGGGEPPNDD